MRGLVWIALALVLLSHAASAKGDLVILFSPFSADEICAGEMLLINITDEDTGRDVSRVQIDFYYGDRKVGYTSTNSDGIATFLPENKGIYRLTTEKSRYNRREVYFTIKECANESTMTSTTSTTSTTLSTTTIPTTSTLGCLFDVECVLCHGGCVLEDVAAEECALNISKSCDCTGGACVAVTTTTTTLPATTTSIAPPPATTTIPPKVESGFTRTLVISVIILIILMAIALFAVNLAVKPLKDTPTSLGGKTKTLTKLGGTTRLETIGSAKKPARKHKKRGKRKGVSRL